MNAKEAVLAFWQAMQTNDFHRASEWLSEDFEGYWPQSRERTLGRTDFAEMNAAYPAAGAWSFRVQRVVQEGNTVVTEVDITDGDMQATAVTFHTVENGLIRRQHEYWPDPYPAPEWRRQWVTVESDTPSEK